jgi:hypothetical protein
MKFPKFLYISILSVFVLSISQPATAKPKNKAADPISYSFVHGIPLGYGADLVDVYANDALIIDNAVPGSIKTFSISRTNLRISVYPNGFTPSSSIAPLLSSPSIYLSIGTNPSFVAHLDSSGKAKLSVFKNMTTAAGSKRSWLTIRHLAFMPEVQFRINAKPVFVPFPNSSERKRSLAYGSYSLDGVTPDSSTVIAPALNFNIEKEKNLVIYLWGVSASPQYLKQVVITK